MTEQIGLEIEINGATKSLKSVKDLTDAVKELEKKASEADFGSDEYKKATQSAEELKKKMGELSGESSQKLGKSLSELKKQYKDLKVALSEASNPQEFSRLSKQLNEVEGKIGDMNDAANIATGSGVEQLQKGMALVGEGFRNFDFEKIKIGFKGIGQAMSAAAPLLLVAAIGYLIENFDKVVEVVKMATGTFSEEEQAVKRTTKAYEAQKKATSALVAEYDNEIKILEAQGASDAKILEFKKKKIQAQILEQKASIAVQDATIAEIKSNDDLSESLMGVAEWIQRKLGNDKAADIYAKSADFAKKERVKEFEDKKTESLKTISSLETDLVVLQINNDKKVIENAKKTNEEKKKLAEQQGEENYNRYKAEQEKLSEEEAVIVPENKQAIAQTELEINAAKNAELLNQSALQYEADKQLAIKAAQEKAKAKQALEKSSFDAAKNLSDAVFSIQIGNAKKGSAEETKLKKQQFEVNKAFAVTQATIDGIRAVQTVLASYPTPFNIPIAIATGISSAANIAKIASTKFEGGGGGSASAPTAIGGGNTTLPTPPTINQNNTKTNFDEQGNSTGVSTQRQMIDITGKVLISQNQIEASQRESNKLKAQTTI